MDHKQQTGRPSIDKPWLKYYSEEAINAPLPERTMYTYLWEQNKDHLDDIALNYYGHSISYGRLFSRVDDAAKAMYGLGVREGDTVSMCVLNTPEAVYSIYAVNKLGAVCNIIEPRTNADQIKARVNAAGSKVLILLDVFYGKIKDILPDTCVEKVLVLSLGASMPLAVRIGFELTKGRKIEKAPRNGSFLPWDRFISQSGSLPPATEAPYKKDSAAAIIYTGGTTGTPKGAMLSNYGVNAVAVQYVLGLHQKRKESFLNIMPPFIAYGFVFGLHTPLCSGLTNILIPSFQPSEIGKLFVKYKPSHYIGVPAHFEQMMNCRELQNEDLSFLYTAGMGGDRVAVAVEEAINTFLLEHHSPSKAMKGYGMTELGSSACTTTIHCNKVGSVGIPLVKNTISIFEPGTEHELTYDQEGEVCITGPGMMLEYYNDPAETEKVAKTHQDGRVWIHSGDIGYIDKDGVLFIIDRMKRVIIRPDGHNVWPSQIESVLARHPAVEACAVVGAPNPEGENGQIPVAFLVLKQGFSKSDRLIQDIDAHSKKCLPERDVALAYYFCDSLPLTPVGKVDYRLLEQTARSEAAALS